MAHIHSVYDSDKHFTIDPLTRDLKNMTPGKAGIMQYDHNSERITFELPAVIEGHNTLDCNVVEVHYLNIDAQTKDQNRGLYEVDDLQASPDDSSIAVCSWLISRNATQLVGPLYFRLTFKCVTDVIDYSWSTAVYKALSVSDGINNSDWVAEEYSDILEQWRVDLFNGAGNGGGVTSWNDLTDKPFYTGNPVETEVFNLSTALFQDDEPIWKQLMPIDDTTYLWVSHPETLEQVFEVGKEYTVVIDGVEHKTTAIDSAVLLGEVGPEVGLGDIESLLSDTLPDSFQYAIQEIDDYGYPYFHIWYKGETAPTEFKVLGIKPEIVKIDPKYLPDGGVGYVTEGEYGVLRERTVEITGIGDDVWGDEHKLLSRNLVLAAGETYRVTVNGVVYERVAYYDPDDATIILVGGDSDPFKLQNQHGWIYFYPEENGTYTVKLEGKPAPVYHKIDPRFLPDDIVTGEDLDNVLEEVQTMIDAAGGGGGLSRDEVQTMIDTTLGVIENGTY